MSFTPTPADKFSFGLWTIGWVGQDQFGSASRAPLDVVEAVTKLAEIGAYGLTFHDNDLFPFEATDAERTSPDRSTEGGPGRHRRDRCRWSPPTCSATRCSRTAGSPPTTAPSVGSRCARCCATSTWPPSWVRRRSSCGAAARAASSTRPRTCRPRWPATARRVNLLAEYVTDQGYDLRFAIEPKPNEPRGDILLPTVGHAMAFIDTLDQPDLFGVNPEVGHEQMAGLNFTHGIAQALDAGKLFHIDLNGQRSIKFDQDLVFGHGDLQNAFSLVDLLENGGPDGGPAYTGPRHFDYKPSRTEDYDGVWESAKANMRMYLLLKERAAAFRADPEVQEALAAAKVAELSEPTLNPGETYTDLLADACAYEDFDAEPYFNGKGFGFVKLQQLALEHLMGARG